MMITIFPDHFFTTLGANTFPAWHARLMRNLCTAMQANAKTRAVFLLLVLHFDWFI
jgi:hypothetical protein